MLEKYTKKKIKLVPTSFPANGAGIPSPSLFPGHGPDPSHDDDLSPDCVLCNSPHACRGYEICVVDSFLLSDCGHVPWNVLALQRQTNIKLQL